MSCPTAIYSPGPGTYDVRTKVGSGGPQYTLKGRSKKNPFRNNNPGPGSYTLASSQIDKPTNPVYSLGPRIDQLTTDEVPGPGAYNHSAKVGDGPQFSFYPRVSQGGGIEKVPGPGTYEEARTIGTDANKFSMQSRPKTKDFSESPGPGTYEATTAFKKNPTSKAYSLKAKNYRPEHDSAVPGPAAYYPASRLGDAPAPSFGQVIKDSEGVERSPGPAAYYPPDKMGSGKKMGFGYKRKVHVKNSNPGPGSYTARFADKKQAPRYSLGARIDTDFHDRVPGPGSYQVRQPPGSGKKAFSLSGRPKQGPQTARTLGYEYTPRDLNKGPAFSLGGRVYSVNYDGNATPGPGSYNLSRSFVKGGFSWKGRTDKNDSNGVPGPGSYNPAKAKTAPRFSLGGKHAGASTLYASSSNPMQAVK